MVGKNGGDETFYIITDFPQHSTPCNRIACWPDYRPNRFPLSVHKYARWQKMRSWWKCKTMYWPDEIGNVINIFWMKLVGINCRYISTKMCRARGGSPFWIEFYTRVVFNFEADISSGLPNSRYCARDSTVYVYKYIIFGKASSFFLSILVFGSNIKFRSSDIPPYSIQTWARFGIPKSRWQKDGLLG